MSTTNRVLFDQAFLQAGCNQTLVEFDEDFVVDDLPWTYGTNYAIGAVAIALASSIFYRNFFTLQRSQCGEKVVQDGKNTSNVSNIILSMLVLGYLILSGVGYVVAGVGHQILERKSDGQGELFQKVSYSFVSMGTACLWGETMLLLNRTNKRNRILFGVWLTTNLAVLIVTAVTGHMTVAGAWLLLSNVVAFIALVLALSAVHKKGRVEGTEPAGKEKTSCVMKSLAMLLSVAGLLVQLLLAPTCGAGGYKECFQNCPLPNPKQFNHNALFHVPIVFSFVFYGIGELISPSSRIVSRIITKESQASTTQKDMDDGNYVKSINAPSTESMDSKV